MVQSAEYLNMELRDCYIEAVGRLATTYGKVEAEALVLRLLEDRYGISRERLFMEGGRKCSFLRGFMSCVEKIRKGCPIQHITGFQEFLGRRFSVSSSVLVPRQETEQLVQNVIKEWQNVKDLAILDIGTGSGAIAVTLAMELPRSKVTGIDISCRALAIARKNAEALGAEVEFLSMDFLKSREALDGRKWDIIISNPPYIPIGERDSLPSNVRGHDPQKALFVNDRRPLIFYEVISEYAFKSLKSRGMLFFEINEKYGKKTADAVQKAGFEDVKVEKDLMDKQRFVWSRKR